MQWLSENWVWVLVGIAFVAMHLFGHGGHGGHGGPGRDEGDRQRTPEKPAPQGGHRH